MAPRAEGPRRHVGARVEPVSALPGSLVICARLHHGRANERYAGRRNPCALARRRRVAQHPGKATWPAAELPQPVSAMVDGSSCRGVPSRRSAKLACGTGAQRACPIACLKQGANDHRAGRVLGRPLAGRQGANSLNGHLRQAHSGLDDHQCPQFHPLPPFGRSHVLLLDNDLPDPRAHSSQHQATGPVRGIPLYCRIARRARNGWEVWGDRAEGCP